MTGEVQALLGSEISLWSSKEHLWDPCLKRPEVDVSGGRCKSFRVLRLSPQPGPWSRERQSFMQNGGVFLMNGFWRRNRDFFRKLERKIRIFIPFPSQNTLRRWFPRFEERNIAYLFAQEGIDTIIDVGAHNGEFATKMRSCRYRGRIISFEPVSAFHQLLLDKSRADGAWEIAPRMGLGATPGALEIKILGTHSSFQKMLYQSESGSEIVTVRTLDDVLPELKIPDAAKIALKIDVQGFEKDVLDGALKTLGRVKAIFIEVSLKPLYVGEVYYLEMLSYLRDKGFHVVYFSPVVNRQRLGEMWQVDALLIRKEIP